MEGSSLAGVVVAVTRATDQASSLAERLGALGAEVLLVPTIEVVDAADRGSALRDAVDRIDRYRWLVVTSANGARRVAQYLNPEALVAAGTGVAAIGPGTAETLTDLGFTPDLLPSRFVAEGLLEVFPPPTSGGERVLLAQAAGARPVLADGLAAEGWEVDRVEAYRTVHPEVAPEVAHAAVEADVVTFTSASTVTGYVAGVGVDPPPRAVACIGPITAQAASDAGLDVDAVADPHTVDGLVEAVVRVVGRRP